MPKFTKGPWTCDVDEAVGGSIQVYPEGHFLEPWIADVKCEHVGPQSREEIKANAQLISAAPEMYEVLKAMIEETVDYMTINKLGAPEKQHNIEWARAVLAKAEGKS